VVAPGAGCRHLALKARSQILLLLISC
jgi:hypothetical protein